MTSLPVVAIVGRPNVGKSTLFNCLTAKRDALVADFPGLTRDRQYGYVQNEKQSFIVVDSGGIYDQVSAMNAKVQQQVERAIAESSVIMFLVDAQAGLTAVDEQLAARLRKTQKPIVLVINKIDGFDPAMISGEFYQLGFDRIIPIAALRNRGIRPLLECITTMLPKPEVTTVSGLGSEPEKMMKVAIIGRPNVGKSTLVNRILGEERVVVSDEAGTTRDSIFIPFERRGRHYTLIDTAGIRSRGKVVDTVEKFSVVKALQAIHESHVVVLLIDAQEGLTDQDMRLLGLILDSGKALVVVVNKWDGLDAYQKTRVKTELQRRLPFLDYVKWHFISALHGSGVGNLFTSIDRAYQSAMVTLETPQLTRILEKAVSASEPPLVGGKRIKLRYAHPGGHNPPLIVVHGSRTELLPEFYRRYLENTYRKVLKLVGTPIRVELRSSKNPYC